MNKIEVENDCCRFCLEKRGHCTLITSLKHVGLTIEKIFYEISGFKIQRNDPRKICEQCWGQLVMCFQFIQKVRETEKKLREPFNIQPKLEPEDSVDIYPIYPTFEDSFGSQSDTEKDYGRSSSSVKPPLEKSKEPEDAIKWLQMRGISVVREKDTKPGRTFPKATSISSASSIVVKRLGNKKRTDAKSCDFCWEEYPGQECKCPIVKESPKTETTSKIEPAQPPSEVEKNVLCYVCGTTLTNRMSWNQHISKHNAIKEGQKLTCDICGKIFLTKHNIKKHLAIHVDLNIVCSHCGKRFKTQYRYKIHLMTHTQERKFVCHYNCGLTFKTAKTMYTHEKIHRPERDYICPVCDAGFNISSTLRDHVEKRHPEYKLPPKGTILNRKYKKDGNYHYYHENMSVANKE